MGLWDSCEGATVELCKRRKSGLSLATVSTLFPPSGLTLSTALVCGLAASKVR